MSSHVGFELMGPPQRPVDVTDVLFVSQGGGIAIRGGTVNINDCAIHNNQAAYVSTRANFEQRAHHNAPLM